MSTFLDTLEKSRQKCPKILTSEVESERMPLLSTDAVMDVDSTPDNDQSLPAARQGGAEPQEPQLELVQRIESRMAELGLNKRSLANAANISRQTLYNLLAVGIDGNNKLPNLDTLLALGSALQMHPYRLIEGVFLQARMPAILKAETEGDRGGFVNDVTFPDGSIIVPGSRFEKIWRIQNLGTEVWEDRKLVCWDEHVTVTSKKTGEILKVAEGLVPDALEILIPRIEPGQVFDVKMHFTAPKTTGTVMSYWLGTFADGVTPCFPEDAGVWVRLHVTSLAETVAFRPKNK